MSVVLPNEMVQVRLVDESISVLDVEQSNQPQTYTAGYQSEFKDLPESAQMHNDGDHKENGEDPEMHCKPEPDRGRVEATGLELMEQCQDQNYDQGIRTASC